MSTDEEMALVLENNQFFERVRQHFNDETTNQSFLQLINLFNEGIIDIKTTINKAADFLEGDPALFDQLKQLVSYGATIHVADDRLKTNGHTSHAQTTNIKSNDSKRVRY